MKRVILLLICGGLTGGFERQNQLHQISSSPTLNPWVVRPSTPKRVCDGSTARALEVVVTGVVSGGVVRYMADVRNIDTRPVSGLITVRGSVPNYPSWQHERLWVENLAPGAVRQGTVGQLDLRHAVPSEIVRAGVDGQCWR